MIKNYITTSIRNLLRYKAYSAINIAGLVIGMVSSIFLVMWVLVNWNVNRFHENLDRLSMVAYYLDLETGRQLGTATQAPMAPLLKESIPGIEDYVRLVQRAHTLSYGERSRVEWACFADTSILSVLTFPMLRGDPASALRTPRSVILTEAAADRYFGDENPLGKLMVLNDAISLEVTGVLETLPLASTYQFEVLVPFELLNEVGENTHQWAGHDYTTLLLTSPGIATSELSRQVGDFCHDFYYKGSALEESDLHHYVLPLADLHLYGVDGKSGSLNSVLAASIIAFCMLIVSVVNFVLLTTARISNRSQEAGIRKVMGASPGQIVRQAVMETTTVSLIAMLISVAIVELSLTAANAALGNVLQLHSYSLELGGLLVLWVVVTGLLGGIFPAISLSATRPAAIIHGDQVTGRKGRRLRHTMVVAQFSISVVFLTLATLLHQQLWYVATKDLGLDKENVVRLPATTKITESYELFRSRLLRNPGVLNVTTAGQNIVHINSSIGNDWNFEGRDPNTRIEVHFDWVGYDYDKVFKLEMAQGRFYSEEYPSDARDGIVINEEAMHKMGISNPIGKRFSFWGRDKTIIGVVRDFHLEPLDETIKPLILIFEPVINFVYVRIAPDNQSETIAAIEAVYQEMSPGSTFTYLFLGDNFISSQEKLLSLVAIFDFAAVLVAFIAGLGLLALVSFMAEQRRHEIGIRKTLGASTSGIVRLFLLEFMKLVAVSLAIGCPVAYYLGNDWLSSMPYRTEIGWELFAITCVLAVTVVLLTIGFQVIRAARANPVDSLRCD